MAAAPGYGSDLVVDLLRAVGIDHVALNPGATYRGLHDSLVNYGGRSPELILTTHEEIAVALAHGYAKAAGRPMAAVVHDIVGLQHASMAIFNAFCDRAPVLVLGATGPMDATRRRPWIDWIHTALVQGTQVRDYVKLDDQPATLAALPEAFLRAWRIASSEPLGPVYLCLDAALQEQPIEHAVAMPDVSRFRPATPPHADPQTHRRGRAPADRGAATPDRRRIPRPAIRRHRGALPARRAPGRATDRPGRRVAGAPERSWPPSARHDRGPGRGRA